MNRAEYGKYLQSQEWRATRNAALKRAAYRCVRCGRKRRLQVHHRTYERLGSEHEADLEVLCEDCHSGHHLHDMAGGEESRIYLRLASDALHRNPFADLGDLAEEVKQHCIRLKIKPYSVAAIDKALALLSASHRVKQPRPTVQDMKQSITDGRPITHGEARECLARLGLTGLIRGVPPSLGTIDIHGPVDRESDEFSYEVF